MQTELLSPYWLSVDDAVRLEPRSVGHRQSIHAGKDHTCTENLPLTISKAATQLGGEENVGETTQMGKCVKKKKETKIRFPARFKRCTGMRNVAAWAPLLCELRRADRRESAPLGSSSELPHALFLSSSESVISLAASSPASAIGPLSGVGVGLSSSAHALLPVPVIMRLQVVLIPF